MPVHSTIKPIDIQEWEKESLTAPSWNQSHVITPHELHEWSSWLLGFGGILLSATLQITRQAPSTHVLMHVSCTS